MGSKLPDGATLGTAIFNLLIDSGTVVAEATGLSKVREALQRDELRLETFLEFLAQEVSPEIPFKPFASLETAEPCFAHFAILALSLGPLITTNLDILFERAAQRLGLRRRVIHLHGRCDRMESIVAIISQYLGGLDASVRKSFESAIKGRHLVVFGYSGRDRDVMPVLVAARPERIEWVRHIGSSVSPELERAQATFGDRLNVIEIDSDHWLTDQLTAAETTQIRARVNVPPYAVAPLQRGWFEPITFLQRNKAIARILEHLGAYGDALVIYRQLCKAVRKDPELMVDLGRVVARVEGHNAARDIYSVIARRKDLPVPVRAQVLLENADALRNTSRATQARQVLTKLERFLNDNRRAFRNRGFQQERGWLQAARAGIDRLEGHVASARRLYTEAQRNFSRARDIGGHIEALTWQSETALIMGDYQRALELSDAAICDSLAYANGLVRAWPWYVKAEGLVLSGRFEEAGALNERAHAIFEEKGNIQGTFWTLILEIDCLKDKSWRRAQERLDEVWASFGNRSLAHARARLLLEQADLASAAHQWSRVEKALSTLRLHVRNKSHLSRRPRLIEAHLALVEAECARRRASSDAQALLERVKTVYEKLGAKGMAARTAVALALARNGHAPIKQLRQTCVRRGYCLEVRALDAMSPGYYPIQFI